MSVFLDGQIAERVHRAMLSNPIVNPYDIDVEVRRGTVFLKG